MVDEVTLAELLIARMSHDISGPIGAVNNGIEFIVDEDFGEQDEALDLLASSAKEAVARLQYYRYAYGIVSYGNQADTETIHKLISSLFECGKVTVNWNDYSNQIIIKSETAKTLMNLLSVASSMLIRGGTVNFSVDGTEMSLIASGQTLKEHDSIDLLISDSSSSTVNTSNIHLHYLKQIIIKSQMNLQYSLQENEVVFKCS